MVEQRILQECLNIVIAYDLVTARAVARLVCLMNFVFLLFERGGMFVAMKGADLEDELKESKISYYRAS